MPKLSSRVKLFIVIVLFALFTAGMFTFGYGILEDRNTAKLDVVTKQNLELEVLKREQKNFEQGKIDLVTLEAKAFPPQDLFSKDTKVVKEIKVLEELATRYSLETALSVSGNSKTATKAPGVSAELLVVPYTLTVDGAFNNILSFINAMEHTSFITQTNGIQINASADGKTRGVLSSQFYLKP